MKLIKKVFLGVVMMLAVQAYSGLAYAAEVNINQADASTIATELTGVGEVKAQAIVEYRMQNGPFTSLEDLQKVKGISAKTIEKNRANLSL